MNMHFLKHPLLYVWLILGGMLLIAANLPDRATLSFGPPPAPKPIASVEDCSGCNDHDKLDLLEQRRMAVAAERQVWVGIGGLVALVLTLGLNAVATMASNRAAHAAQETVKTMRATAMLENRAWLKVSPTGECAVQFSGDEVLVSFSVQVQNTGKLPARAHVDGATHRARGYIVAKTGLSRHLERERLFISRRDVPGYMLMPNESYTFSFSGPAQPDPYTEQKYAEEKATIEAAGMPSWVGPISLSASCVVFYKSIGATEWHCTAHVLLLSKRDNTEFDPALGNVAADNLRIIIYPADSEVT